MTTSDAVRRSSVPEHGRVRDVSTTNALDGKSSQAVDEQAVEEIVDGLNEYAQQVERQLQFSVDEESGKTVIKVIDAKTDELVRQIPSEDLLKLQQRLGNLTGLLLEAKA